MTANTATASAALIPCPSLMRRSSVVVVLLVPVQPAALVVGAVALLIHLDQRASPMTISASPGSTPRHRIRLAASITLTPASVRPLVFGIVAPGAPLRAVRQEARLRVWSVERDVVRCGLVQGRPIGPHQTGQLTCYCIGQAICS